VTNAGGPAVLATDALIARGGELTPLSQESLESLNRFLPPHWSHGNPIDILGDADSERYERALQIALADPDSDGLLAILAPQGMTNPTQVAERIKDQAKNAGKPVLASWMGGKEVAAGDAVLSAAGIPTFAYPDTAARAFNLMWRYEYNRRAIYETPMLVDAPEATNAAHSEGQPIVREVRLRGRTLLTEYESKQLLRACGIPTVEALIAQSEDEAAKLAAKVGFPVVLKLHSEMITHKTDVGGVKLNLTNDRSVREAYRDIERAVRAHTDQAVFLGVTVQPMVAVKGYELIVGSTTDAQFGPVIIFGSGGELVEVYRDRALALPPLNTTLAQRMMEQTRIFKALRGVRGRRPANIEALEAVLVRFSRLIVENPAIKEADINPLLVAPDEIVALDARVVLHPGSVPDDELPRSAIRPYPFQYVGPWKMKDGTEVTIRPIRPEDEPLMVKFHEALSERSVHLRYFHPSKLSQRVAHDRLARICFLDYDREIALLVQRTLQETGAREILAVGRMTKLHGSDAAELAVLVRDQYQRLGLGTELVRRLIGVARDEGISCLHAYILQENVEMQALIRKAGFHIALTEDPAVLFASMKL